MSDTFTEIDRKHMAHALELARATEALASPNPQVGCVIARGEDIVGEGAHRYAARDHAEVVALRQAGNLAHGATAYVTLEPCSHHGRTGPCAHALVDAGVVRVVAATLDPNPEVSGAGIAYLQEHGVAAEHGLMETEAREVNDAFAHFMLTNRPLVTLKAALSVDGKLAPLPFQRTAATPFWLTGTAAREEVHRVRHAHDAILTGVGTLIADDPLLTDRSSIPRRRPLLRVLLDTNLRAPLSARLFDTAQDDVLVLCGANAPEDKQKLLRSMGVRVEPIALTQYADGLQAIDLKAALSFLGTQEILSVLVEGGSKLNATFLDAELVDKVIFFFSEVELGNDAMPFATGNHSPFALIERLQKIERCDFKNTATGSVDACVRGNLRDPWADVFTLTPPKRAR